MIKREQAGVLVLLTPDVAGNCPSHRRDVGSMTWRNELRNYVSAIQYFLCHFNSHLKTKPIFLSPTPEQNPTYTDSVAKIQVNVIRVKGTHKTKSVKLIRRLLTPAVKNYPLKIDVELFTSLTKSYTKDNKIIIYFSELVRRLTGNANESIVLKVPKFRTSSRTHPRQAAPRL